MVEGVLLRATKIHICTVSPLDRLSRGVTSRFERCPS